MKSFQDHPILQPLASFVRDRGIQACMKKAEKVVRELGPSRILDVGGGKHNRWGAEVLDAEIDPQMDFNTKPLPYSSGTVGVVVCEQTIEHLHNTTWFLQELARVLKPAGHLVLATENLASWPNRLALLFGMAPFTLQSVCGAFIGGWKRGLINPGSTLPHNHPAFSGVRGHVRGLTTKQWRTLLEAAGFRVLKKWGFGLDHYILFHCVKW